MNVLVTGGAGFIGNRLVPVLLRAGHQITIVVRGRSPSSTVPAHAPIEMAVCDLGDAVQTALLLRRRFDALIHLAWQDIGECQSSAHTEQVLPIHKRFVEAAAASGISRIVVTGTCLEYGQIEGQLSEDMPANPTCSYGAAKLQLYEHLRSLSKRHSFSLRWCRPFYVFGPGQRETSLFPSLLRAIAKRQPYFEMSRGDQIRDFIHVDQVARKLRLILEARDFSGIVNCCSGQPTTVADFALNCVRLARSDIELRFGALAYPDYEPFRFWGSNEVYCEIEGAVRG